MGAACSSVCGSTSKSNVTERGRRIFETPPFFFHRIPVPFTFGKSKMPPMNRRTFIGTSIAATLAAAAKPSWAADTAHHVDRSAVAHSIDRVGLQLYTVRDAMKTDFEGTIAKVASIGYKEVEFAGYFDHSPKDVRAILDHHGLTASSTHVDYDRLGANFSEIIETAKIVGHEYIVNPAIDDSMWRQIDGWKRAADTFNRAGEASRRAGI